MEGAADKGPVQSVFFKPQEVVVTDNWAPTVPMVSTPQRPPAPAPAPAREDGGAAPASLPATGSWHTLQGVSSWARSSQAQEPQPAQRTGRSPSPDGSATARHARPPRPPVFLLTVDLHAGAYSAGSGHPAFWGGGYVGTTKMGVAGARPPPPPAEMAAGWGEAAEVEALYHTKVAETLHHVEVAKRLRVRALLAPRPLPARAALNADD